MTTLLGALWSGSPHGKKAANEQIDTTFPIGLNGQKEEKWRVFYSPISDYPSAYIMNANTIHVREKLTNKNANQRPTGQNRKQRPTMTLV